LYFWYAESFMYALLIDAPNLSHLVFLLSR